MLKEKKRKKKIPFKHFNCYIPAFYDTLEYSTMFRLFINLNLFYQ